MATLQTKQSGNKFWDDILFHTHESGGSELPTITTDSLNMLNNLNAHVEGTVVSQGSSDLVSYGFVWSIDPDPTGGNIVEVGTGSFTGAFSDTINSLPFFSTVYFSAYATNSFGTSYGAILSGVTQICFAEGTLISTANGHTKKIEDIQYSDDLLVWNFDEAVLDHSKPVWMVMPFKSSYYGLVKFSNGLELKTVADGRGHRIFNIEKGMFTYSMCEDTPIGTITFTTNNEVVRVIDKEIVRKDTTFYNIITHTHMNLFANSILTSTGLNNIYPIIGMKFVKDNRKPRDREDFWDISEDLFNGLRLAEQPIYCYNKVKVMMSRQLI